MTATDCRRGWLTEYTWPERGPLARWRVGLCAIDWHSDASNDAVERLGRGAAS